ncbi:hypothetical protein FPZ43_13980 [Mucilaginibacter pallidiroseus]|uniref:Glycosyltransferase subfamily 4-like N-terminal domain-containing protein n=1 Tax=Mucilaginibacter pallidiroseus TaxID=2599295 RepID=A0A563U8A9_9SPHI|nr:glycosyltransferase [Mucilaginibacter pallidiroseus]TWR27575.1 hypothetical protein FPZ43_13980 [Mucilaginibacter pallidiroseus]
MANPQKGISVVVVCSSLQQGRDGVGDYCRRLAANLLQVGHRAAIIALNDRFTNEVWQGVQHFSGYDIPVMRLPAQSLTVTATHAQAATWISEQQPQWLSLQFVPFGFHPKGLKIGLGTLLSKLNQGARWHVMFHELWVGMDVEGPFKHRLWGWLQRRLISLMLNKLDPVAVSTQTLLYKKYLAQMGYDATVLPLFSNIININKELRPQVNLKDKPYLTLAVFGSIHHSDMVRSFLIEVADFGRANNQKVNINLLGRCGNEKLQWEKYALEAGINVSEIGEQDPEMISAYLHNADIGISTTPVTLTEKSGSFAALREHGLPVISVSRPWHAHGFPEDILPDDVFYYQNGNFKDFMNTVTVAVAPRNNADRVAQQFINLLQSN